MSIPEDEDPNWNWTFHYILSQKVYCKKLKEAPYIRFTKLSEHLVGFDLIVNNKALSYAEKICKKRANNLGKILTIKSGMTIIAMCTGYEGVNRITGKGRTGKASFSSYDIKGWIDELDLTNSTMDRLINQDTTQELGWLNDAVSHINNGRTIDCIKTAFKIIEHRKDVENYSKYKCIRDIFSHSNKKGYRSRTMKAFDKEFGATTFDLKPYGSDKGVFNLDLESPKTKENLDKLAHDIIKEAKTILKLE